MSKGKTIRNKKTRRPDPELKRERMRRRADAMFATLLSEPKKISPDLIEELDTATTVGDTH